MPTIPGPYAANLNFLQGGGEVGALIRAKDWSQTQIGNPETWPQSLRTAVSLCLASNFPINIVWGSGAVQIYNDAYRAGCGDAHPQALGEDYRITWASAWPVIGRSFERAQTGETMFLENQRMFLRRLDGELAETFFTFSHSPIRDETGGIGGLFHPVTETTPTMLAERRTRALRQLATSLAAATNEADIARRTVDVLAGFDADLPFVLFYRLDAETGQYRLDRSTGIESGVGLAPFCVGVEAVLPWPVAYALAANAAVEVGDLAARFGELPVGPYPEAPDRAFLIPIPVPAAQSVPALVIAGVSSRLPIDDEYRSFHRLLGVTVAGALATVRGREDERRRTEALAEIDRAKTAFFANVSHEFRTPLTLMLGPIEDALAAGNALPLDQRERLEIAHRNSLRLLRLVNALLDFSRLEAGRTEAVFRPVDLATLTADLASSFRSATDRAGIALAVDTPPLSQPAYVDRDLWEKIVLNLLSNAFKFTFEGEIAVTLREVDGTALLTVRDTGTGIPANELPKLFERFHRVAGARGRSIEGSGIGLTLVQELVKQHGGDVAVESEVGRGTLFTITIPLGTAHLPADHVADAPERPSFGRRTHAFVEEALRWLPDSTRAAAADESLAVGGAGSAGMRRRVLVADDNADLRDYLARLLVGQDYEVEAASDGDAALDRLNADRFDLLVTDVMMPGTDGFALLRAVRGDPGRRDMPVILLSARAGEEARIEGLEAGADDYLTKPFSGRELVARVAAAINIADVRREGAAALRDLNETLEEQVVQRTAERDRLWETSPDLLVVIDFDGYFRRVNPAWTALLGYAADELIGHHVNEFVLPDDHAGTVDAYELAAAGGLPHIENRYRHKDGSTRWISWVAATADGLTYATGRNVTREKEQQAELEAAQDALRQSQKMEAIGQLTGGVAHDFNNLLTIIRSSVDLLRRPDVKEERRERYLDAMSETVDRAAKLTGQLLAFARRQALKSEVFDVGSKLRGLNYMLDTVTGSRVQVTLDTPDNPCFIKADVSQFETALVNMAANARDAMSGAGHLTLRVECGRSLPAIRGHAGSSSRFTIVSVADTGCGITADQIAHIFEPFFTTKEVGKGTGLGLSQVFGFAKQSGGDVDVESRPGIGTTFRLYLPEAEPDGAPDNDSDDQSEGVPLGHGQCVLVVEDSVEVGQFCTHVLHDLGYKTARAVNAEEALNRLGVDGNGVDAVFSDVVMPGMGGVEFAKTLRRTLPAMPILLTSGYSHVLAREGDQGFELLRKPYSAEQLARTLRRVLAQTSDTIAPAT